MKLSADEQPGRFWNPEKLKPPLRVPAFWALIFQVVGAFGPSSVLPPPALPMKPWTLLNPPPTPGAALPR